MFDKARQLTDEATGMPSYSHGGTGISGVGRTASGMSMLMGAADKNIKAVVRNIDDYFLAPYGGAMIAFNHQFDFDPELVGDMAAVARGTESLMRNEVRSQKLMQFLQIGSNPSLAPYVKFDYILTEIAASLDLDEEKILYDPAEIQINKMIAAQNQQQEGGLPPELAALAQGGGGEGNATTGVPNVADPTGTGGGNISPGAAPEPGAAGFTSPQAPQQ